MQLKKYSTLFIATLFLLQVNAQESWSLEKCINYAQQNSLSVKQAEARVSTAAINNKERKWARLPNLNGSGNAVFSFGRTIDPVTNSFANERRFSNDLSLSSNLPLYTGGRINSRIEQGKYDLMAAEANAKASINNLSIQIADVYLNILTAQEQLSNAQKRKDQTVAQLSQSEKLVKAGTLPRADLLDLEAQLAANEQEIAVQENQITLNYLQLKQLLVLPPDEEIEIVKPPANLLEAQEEKYYSLGDVYEKALQTQPQIIAADNQLKSAQLNVDIARADMLPSLSMFGQMFTRYSDKAFNFTAVPPSDDYPYFDQISDNFGQAVGISLNVPIFNRGAVAFSVERARINVIENEIDNKQIKQQLANDVQQAITSVKANKNILTASQKAEAARQFAFKNAEKRLELGVINTLEFTTAQNALAQAEIDLIVAKYNYIFSLKVLDFYMGKKIQL